jgi:hypothetical protein
MECFNRLLIMFGCMLSGSFTYDEAKEIDYVNFYLSGWSTHPFKYWLDAEVAMKPTFLTDTVSFGL